MTIRMVRTIHPVTDPGCQTDRRDFYASHYRFNRVSDGIAIHSLTRPDVEATVVFTGNLACCSVETTPMVADLVEPEMAENYVRYGSLKQQQGKRK